MRTEAQCAQCLIQMPRLSLRIKMKMEVGVLLEAVLKLGAEAPHQEAPPPVGLPQLMIVPWIVQPAKAPPKKEAPQGNCILAWAQPKRLEDKINSWKTPLNSSCLTQ